MKLSHSTASSREVEEGLVACHKTPSSHLEKHDSKKNWSHSILQEVLFEKKNVGKTIAFPSPHPVTLSRCLGSVQAQGDASHQPGKLRHLLAAKSTVVVVWAGLWSVCSFSNGLYSLILVWLVFGLAGFCWVRFAKAWCVFLFTYKYMWTPPQKKNTAKPSPSLAPHLHALGSVRSVRKVGLRARRAEWSPACGRITEFSQISPT